MYRNITNKLVEWKNSSRRKPLLISGARQTGKTFIIREFGNKYYEDVIEVNFEKDRELKTVFDNSLKPLNIVTDLENYYGKRIYPEKTLIFFDEIQSCPAAVTAMKYFYEDANDYHVIGAGSLLGVAISRNFNNRSFSFPVGKVDSLRLYPMNFQEFLIAMNETMLLETIEKCYASNECMSEILHSKALKLYRDYLVIGGMPEAVQEFINTGSYIASTLIVSRIYDDYLSDTTKYASGNEAIKNKSCYDTIAKQLLKTNKNFKYSEVQKGKNAQYFGSSIDWLVNAGIALKSMLLDQTNLPLSFHTDDFLFRIYLSDVGLFRHKANLRISNILDIDYRDDMTGILAENYVACELSSYGIPLYYWTGKANAEIEFMVEYKNCCTPFEVKAGKRVTSKSLDVYKKTHKAEFVFRVSQKNFGSADGIRSVPLYATFCIAKEIVSDQSENVV